MLKARTMATDFPEITRPNARAFLTAYATMGVVSRAAKAADIVPKTHWNWSHEDGERGDRYRAAFAEARRQACDVLETEARRRACDGVKRLRFYKGEPIIDPTTGKQYAEHEYSDTLMMFMLKGSLPEKYRERHSVETSGPGGGPITFKAEDLTDDELAVIAKGQNGEAGRKTNDPS